MAKRRARRRRRSAKTMIVLTWITTVIGAVGIASVADNWLAGGLVGAVIGLVVGIALAAFPNLDVGGPADTPGMFDGDL